MNQTKICHILYMHNMVRPFLMVMDEMNEVDSSQEGPVLESLSSHTRVTLSMSFIFSVSRVGRGQWSVIRYRQKPWTWV